MAQARPAKAFFVSGWPEKHATANECNERGREGEGIEGEARSARGVWCTHTGGIWRKLPPLLEDEWPTAGAHEGVEVSLRAGSGVEEKAGCRHDRDRCAMVA